MPYKLEDILSKEEKDMREINKQKAGNNSVQIKTITQKPKKTHKKKETIRTSCLIKLLPYHFKILSLILSVFQCIHFCPHSCIFIKETIRVSFDSIP